MKLSPCDVFLFAGICNPSTGITKSKNKFSKRNAYPRESITVSIACDVPFAAYGDAASVSSVSEGKPFGRFG